MQQHSANVLCGCHGFLSAFHLQLEDVLLPAVYKLAYPWSPIHSGLDWLKVLSAPCLRPYAETDHQTEEHASAKCSYNVVLWDACFKDVAGKGLEQPFQAPKKNKNSSAYLYSYRLIPIFEKTHMYSYPAPISPR